MERLILDTGVLIALERGRIDPDRIMSDEDDPALAAVSAAELLEGVELADGARREKRQAFVDDVLAQIPVEEYSLEVARIHARLLAHVRREGRPRGAHDLMIAATAVATGRAIVSSDAKARFAELPGVRVAPLLS